PSRPACRRASSGRVGRKRQCRGSHYWLRLRRSIFLGREACMRSEETDEQPGIAEREAGRCEKWNQETDDGTDERDGMDRGLGVDSAKRRRGTYAARYDRPEH